MTIKLNDKALQHAKRFINDGKYKTGGDWSEDQPSTDDENAYLDEHGFDAYSQWHLGVDSAEDEDNKGRYEFPYGDFKQVLRSGLIAAAQRAGQYDHTDIKNAAQELVDMIDQRESSQ